MNKKQIKASLPPGVLPMSQERSQEILRHAKNNPPVKACRTEEELEEYTTDLLKKMEAYMRNIVFTLQPVFHNIKSPLKRTFLNYFSYFL